MKQTIQFLATLLLFFGILAISFWDEYFDFYKEQKHQEYTPNSQDFETEYIQDISVDRLWHTPDKQLRDILAQRIRDAEKRVYISAYIFTEKTLRDAVIYTHEQWKDVQVLLENNPYRAPYLNDKIYNAFQNEWLPVRWSDPLNYALNHAKYIIIDDSVYISTGNFSYSLFTKNRDLIIETRNPEVLEVLEEVFLADFSHKKRFFAHENLVISPETSRKQLTNLVRSAQNTLDIYFPYVADDAFQYELFSASDRWVRVRFITEKGFYEDAENVVLLEEFYRKGIEVFPIKKYKLHVKAILADEEVLYIGSINFSRYSFDENREIGILLKEQEIISQFLELYNNDL